MRRWSIRLTTASRSTAIGVLSCVSSCLSSPRSWSSPSSSASRSSSLTWPRTVGPQVGASKRSWYQRSLTRLRQALRSSVDRRDHHVRITHAGQAARSFAERGVLAHPLVAGHRAARQAQQRPLLLDRLASGVDCGDGILADPLTQLERGSVRLLPGTPQNRPRTDSSSPNWYAIVALLVPAQAHRLPVATAEQPVVPPTRCGRSHPPRSRGRGRRRSEARPTRARTAASSLVGNGRNATTNSSARLIFSGRRSTRVLIETIT